MRPDDFEYDYSFIGFLLKLPYYLLVFLILVVYSAWALVMFLLMTAGILVGTFFGGFIAMLCKLYKDGNTRGKVLFGLILILLPLGFVAGWIMSFCYMMYQTFPKYL